MKYSILTVTGAASLASAQVAFNPNGTFTCTGYPNGNYCAGDSLTSNIIIRCSSGVGTAGNCNDNLAGRPPVGVSYSPCWQSSTTAGDAACSKDGTVYPDSAAPFMVPGSSTSDNLKPSSTFTATFTAVYNMTTRTRSVTTSCSETEVWGGYTYYTVKPTTITTTSCNFTTASPMAKSTPAPVSTKSAYSNITTPAKPVTPTSKPLVPTSGRNVTTVCPSSFPPYNNKTRTTATSPLLTAPISYSRTKSSSTRPKSSLPVNCSTPLSSYKKSSPAPTGPYSHTSQTRGSSSRVVSFSSSPSRPSVPNPTQLSSSFPASTPPGRPQSVTTIRASQNRQDYTTTLPGATPSSVALMSPASMGPGSQSRSSSVSRSTLPTSLSPISQQTSAPSTRTRQTTSSTNPAPFQGSNTALAKPTYSAAAATVEFQAAGAFVGFGVLAVAAAML